MTKASSQAQNGFLESVALKEGTWASDLLDRGAGQGPSLSSPAPPRWADCSLGQILSLTSRASFFPICKIGHLIPVGGHELVQIFRKSIQPTGAIKKLRQRFRGGSTTSATVVKAQNNQVLKWKPLQMLKILLVKC